MSRGDDHRGTDVTGGGGLAGSALHRSLGEAADAIGGADDGQASTKAGAQEGESELNHGILRNVAA